MTEKRFIDNDVEYVENQSFTDNLTGKIYWIDNGLDEIVECLNNLHEENQALKKHIKVLDQSEEASIKYNLKLAEENQKLKEENKILRKNLSDKDIEWIRNNTTWEQMPSNHKTITKTSDHMGWKSK